MKYIKLCFVLFIITLLTTSSNYFENNFKKEIYAANKNSRVINLKSKNIKQAMTLSNKKEGIISKNKVLSEQELRTLFPDANFRNTITRNFKNQDITLNKIASLSGEFYATGEYIGDLTGISYLANINNFVFFNNNIKELPKEILNLKNIQSINLCNNYITNNTVVNKLIKKGIDVDYNLNFIKDKENQYKLDSYYKKFVLNKGEEVYLGKLIYKYIESYDKYWEVTDEISNNIEYTVSIYDNKILTLEANSKIKAVSPGECTIKISLDDNFYKNSTVIVNIKVKN